MNQQKKVIDLIESTKRAIPTNTDLTVVDQYGNVLEVTESSYDAEFNLFRLRVEARAITKGKLPLYRHSPLGAWRFLYRCPMG